MRDHHILHAARGMTHVWSAAVISGLAVVITGVIAYQSVQARETATRVPARPSTEYVKIMERLDKMEATVRAMQLTCAKALEPLPASEEPSIEGNE